MPRIDRQRRQHREDLALEKSIHLQQFLGRERLHLHQTNAEPVERRQQHVVQAIARARGQRPHLHVDRLELRGGGHPVGGCVLHPRRDLTTQPRDAHLVELVQIRAEDPQELESFEERGAIVERLVQHARVELEPGELSVQEEGRRNGVFDHGR